MARSIAEIYNEMITEKESSAALDALLPADETYENLLANLTSASKVAAWRLLFFIVAVSIWIHETLFDNFRDEIEARAAELYVGVPLWYRDQCYKFQYGDELVWDGLKYGYAEIDEEALIIERAAVIEVGSQVRIKVAKLEADLPAPLTTDELEAFELYMNSIKVAGTNIAVISRDADLLKVAYTVYYDPLVMNSDGELISDDTIKPVEIAINNYIQELPFDGVLNLTKLTDQVQAAEGVIDPLLTTAEAKYGLLEYEAIAREYNADAGHMKIDPLFPLSTQITYIADV